MRIAAMSHYSTAALASAIRADLSVVAAVNYIEKSRDRPYNYTFEPPSGGDRTNAVYAPRHVEIVDLRPFASDLSLDREGFALVDHASAVVDFDDEDEVRRVYYREAERLIAAATGADRVVVFDHTIRRRVPGLEDRTKPGPRQPVSRAHVDYTEKSGPQRVRDLMGDEADALLARRYAIVNLWRPIRGPLRDAPLALCDAGSVAAADLVATDQIYPDRVGEIYYVAHNPAHRWFYAPAMRRDEALLLKCYDSARGGTARFTPHSAFEDPGTPSDVLPRESIELRTLVFYPA
jgi:hypothetical protein